ncbi:MAG: CYTH domain-containing protein [Lachnospiraceae bacterium]|nr:CYTH domain-containing protein [Lachnospiraceae bacterium]
MEIERKFTLKRLPDNIDKYPHHEISQAYILSTDPVIRIRQLDDEYILTYKSSGMMSRIEEELPLNKEAFNTLLKKTDGLIISKTRYLIPEKDSLTIELDCFHGELEGLYLAEVEFESEEQAKNYELASFFFEDVTFSSKYHNSSMSKMSKQELKDLVTDSSRGLNNS